MAAFNAERAIKAILKHEGGYVNHPRDPGGATNMGVTIDTFRRYIKPSGTAEDLRDLTVAQAAHVFKRQYWDRVAADSLPPGVDYATADFAVNSGPSRAAKYLQSVVRVPADGLIGPKTIAAAKAKPAAFIVNRLCDDRLSFLKRLETWPTFGKGWERRVEDVRAQALHWAGSDTPTRMEPPKPDYAPEPPASKPSPSGSVWANLLAALTRMFGGKR